MPERSEEELQKKMLQFQILEGNLRVVRGQMEQALARIEEAGRTKLALEELDRVEADGSAMVPIGAGTFVKGKITDTRNVLVSIGSDMAVMKTREEAIKFTEDRISEMQKLAEELAAQERAVVADLQRLQPEIQRMLQR
ncbi:MAG: prefoldin subunit alpha [Candidatus Aenigmatarchaeota archaeon]